MTNRKPIVQVSGQLEEISSSDTLYTVGNILSNGDITGNTINSLTLTSEANGFEISGGTIPALLTVPSDAIVSGTNTGDQTITLTGDVTGSGTGSFATTLATVTLNKGGTNANLTASNGGIFYSTASAGAILAGTATASKMLLSGATAAPTWSTSTIPTSAGATANKVLLSDGTNYVLSTPTFPNASATSGKIIISDGTNWIASTPTYPNTSGSAGKVVISDGTNNVYSTPTFPNASASSGKFIRSDGTNWVASTPTLPTSAGTSGKILQSNGTNYVESTPTYPSASGSAGKILRADGTNNIYSTSTFADTYTASNLLYSNGSNTVQGLATANLGALKTNSSGVPSVRVIQPWFDPLDFGTVNLWLDATDPYNNGTQPATSTAISTGSSGWNDKSGNGYVAGQSTGADQPLWGSVTQNLLYGITFDGSNDYLSIPSFAIGSQLTMFVVSVSSNNTLFIEQSVNINSHDGFYINGTGNLPSQIKNSSSSVGLGISSNWLGTSTIVGAISYDGSTIKGYRSNTTTVLSASGSITNNTITDTLYIGSRAGSSLFMTGTIFEIIIYSGALSVNKIQYILSALKAKWGTV